MNLVSREDCIAHHGIKGQKWGVRRFQNEDGTLTVAGRQRYGDRDQKNLEKARKKYDKKLKRNAYKVHNEAAKFLNGPDGYAALNKKWREVEMYKYRDWTESPRYKEYVAEAEALYKEAYDREAEKMFGERP